MPGELLLVVACVLTFAHSIDLQLHDGNRVVFNSSMRRSTISVSISSHGKINSSFHVESQILSPLMNRHQIIHGPSKILTNPELNQQLINFNDYDGQEYWLALKHVAKFDARKPIHFVGLRILDADAAYDFLLPAFSQPFSFLPLGSIYRCGEVIVSLSLTHYGVDLGLFSKSGPGTWKNPSGEWGWNWNKRETESVDVGRFTRKDASTPIRIYLSSGGYCQLTPSNIQESDNKELQRSRYLTIEQVLSSSTALLLKMPSSQL